jgi:hypothetical protein
MPSYILENFCGRQFGKHKVVLAQVADVVLLIAKQLAQREYIQ